MVALALWTAGHRRASMRVVLAGSAIAVSMGCLGLAVAPAWGITLAFAALIGLGFGGFAVTLNSLFADGFGQRSGFMINLLNGAYGVGAIAAPLAISAMPGADYRIPYAVLSALALLTIPMLWGTRNPVLAAAADEGPAWRERRRAVRRILLGFGAVYLLYAGVEQGIGLWEATHLIAQGVSSSAAAGYTALFFTTYTLGRFLIAPIALRVAPDRIFISCIAASIGCLVLAQYGPIAPAAYALAGVACGPVFPTGLNWLARALPGVRSGAAVVLAGAGAGGIIFPRVVGQLIDLTDERGIPMILAAVAGAALLGTLNLRRAVHARAPAAGPGSPPPTSAVR